MANALHGKRAIVTAVFLALSVALLVFLIRQITLLDFRRLMSELSGPEVVLLFGIYGLMAYFRGIRLGSLIREDNRLKLTAIAATHAFVNNILPLRLGELSLPFLIKAFTPRGLAAGSLSLVVVRLYDMVSIAALALLSLVVVGSEFSASVRQLLGFSGVAVVVAAALVFCYLGGMLRWGMAILGGMVGLLGRRGRSAAARLDSLAAAMGREIDTMGAKEKYVVLPLASLVVTMLNYSLYYFTMVFMGIDIGFFRNMLASLGELITSFLPNTLGSFGTMEAGWAAGYVLCGVSKADAIATGFIMHGIILLAGVVIAACSAAYLLAERRRSRLQPGT